MRYEWVSFGDANAVAGITRLLPQLFSCKKEAQSKDVIEALGDLSFHAIAAVEEEKRAPACYVGMGTIFFQRTFGRWVAEIHDMVTDWPYRGMGIGRRIVEELLGKAEQFARERNMKLTVNLTSKPDRVAANALYVKMGFALIAKAEGDCGTNLYKKVVG